MTALFWTVAGFLLGSIPFSLLVGKLALRTDIRRYGDGNPGATNVFRAGNRVAGMLALILDMLKGATPVALAFYAFGVAGWSLVPVILAPILGHVFSPWLHFRGGKALAATFGAWSALTVPLGPFVMGLSVWAFYKLLKVSGWAVVAALLVLLAYLLITRTTLPVLVAWAGTVAILAWTHRSDLRQPPRLGQSIGRQP